MKAGWPSENMPPKPAAKFRLDRGDDVDAEQAEDLQVERVELRLRRPDRERQDDEAAASVAEVVRVMRSHLHRLGLAEEAARLDQQHQDQHQEDIGVAILREGIGQIADEEGLQQAEDECRRRRRRETSRCRR